MPQGSVNESDTNMTKLLWQWNRTFESAIRGPVVDARQGPMKLAGMITGHRHALVILSAMISLTSVLSADFVIAADRDELPEFDCVIEPSEVADLGSAVPGVIGKIHAKRSDTVKKGDIVAELESSVETANVVLSKARAELETSIKLREESAAFGRRTRERNQELFRKSSISQQDIDKLNTENRIAELQVHQEHDNKNIASLVYQRAMAVLDRQLIRTPFEGVVMERFKSVGEYIEDDPVVRVAQLDPLHVEVILPVEHMGKLTVGRLAEVIPSVPGFAGQVATVTRVDQVADAASGTFGARLSLPNPDNMIPAGLRCSLTFLPPGEPADPLADDETFTYSTDSSTQEIVDLPQTTEPATSAPEDVIPSGEDLASKYEIPEVESTPVPVLDEVPEEVVASEIDVESTPPPPLDEPAEEIAASDARVESEIADSTDNFRDTGYSNECYRVGPLANETLASELSDTMIAMDSTSQPTLELVNDYPGTEYRVLTTSQPDVEATDDLEGYLILNGIEDIYRLKSGEHNGRISVGLYGSESNALSRQESLNAMGIEAEVVEVHRELSTYWIELSFNSSPKSQFELQSVAISLAPEAIVQLTQCNQQQITRTQ